MLEDMEASVLFQAEDMEEKVQAEDMVDFLGTDQALDMAQVQDTAQAQDTDQGMDRVQDMEASDLKISFFIDNFYSTYK